MGRRTGKRGKRVREARSADKVVWPCEGCERRTHAPTAEYGGDADGDDGICLREKTFFITYESE